MKISGSARLRGSRNLKRLDPGQMKPPYLGKDFRRFFLLISFFEERPRNLRFTDGLLLLPFVTPVEHRAPPCGLIALDRLFA